eukprot:2331059-Amphidinium_carterae.1
MDKVKTEMNSAVQSATGSREKLEQHYQIEGTCRGKEGHPRRTQTALPGVLEGQEPPRTPENRRRT